ncbi:NAD(P)H-binding protein [Microbispora sp. NPDC046973]|uniref:NAD(P)H-binding protein n=1 Tax=Microbispora sp. NPDC046973 TaxID=3155022 RepID=UPI0033EB41F0
MRILVIGATGKTGAPLVAALAERKVPVRAAGRRPPAAAVAGVEPVRFDWTDRATWAPALDGVDAMYLVGPYAEDERAVLVRELLTAAPRVRRVVLLSILGVESLPDAIPMAAWEQNVRESGKEWTIIRPNWFHQNFGHGGFTAGLRESGELALPAADAAVGFVDTRDIAEVAARALTEDSYGGSVLTLTGPQALTHRQALDEIGKAAGRPLRYVPLAPEAFAEGMRAANAPGYTVTWQTGLFRLIREGANGIVTETVAEVTGRPARSLRSYAEEFATVWR